MPQAASLELSNEQILAYLLAGVEANDVYEE